VLLLFCPGVIDPHDQPVTFAASKWQGSAGEFKSSISNVSHPTHIQKIICSLLAIIF